MATRGRRDRAGSAYERILDHIHEGPIKQLAIPGLVLRYITKDLIRYVLAGPCGIEVKDDAAAQSLFDDLSKEIAVVRSDRKDAGKLVLRPELRRTVLDGFRRDARSADQRRQIHEAAVQYFSPLLNAENRAEEIYSRLLLDEDPSQIDSRWLTGVDVLLRSAVELARSSPHIPCTARWWCRPGREGAQRGARGVGGVCGEARV